MNELTKTTPAEQFRAKAAGLMFDTASMTLHQLVDEFVRLTDAMDANMVEGEHRQELNEAGELAARERRLVNAAARCRFGISFDAYDRSSSSDMDW
jgi:hypothetical protein